MVFARHKFLTIVVLIALAAGIFTLGKRYSVESRDKAVEVAVDYSEVDALASATGQPVAQVLQELKKAGVTSVAVQEMTVNDLIQNGQAIVGLSSQPGVSRIYITQPDLAGQVEEYIQASIPGRVTLNSVPSTDAGASAQLLSIQASVPFVRSLPVGLPPEANVVEKQGLAVVARLMNYPGITTGAVDHSLATLKKRGVHTVIFGGDTVLGFRSLIPEVAESFKRNGLNYGAIEFSKQKGDAKLSDKLEENLIRVHSIPAAELPTLDMPSAVDRFAKAAKERNIRILYVRLFDTASPDPIGANVEYISKIVKNVEKEGFEVMPAHPMGTPAVPKALMAVVAAGVAAGVVLLIGSLIELGAATQAIYFALFFVFFAAISVGLGDMGRKMTALAAGAVFPTLAVIFAGQTLPRTGKRGIVAPTLCRFLTATAISASGGVMVASLLSTRKFMLKLDQFAGVKAAQALPLLILAFVFASQIGWVQDKWQEQKRKTVENMKKLFSEPILVWQTIAVFAALVLVALVLARSGNDSGVGVSPLELKFRAILDKVLFVRPRTKEFMFGHPVFMLAIAMVLSGKRHWAIPLLVLGAIGQISVLNTFCHIHTPIGITVARVLIGTVVGSIVGVVVIWIAGRAGLFAKGAEAK